MNGSLSLSSPASTCPTVGILGGGQLARMLALSAHQMGIPLRILSGAGAPAAQVTRQWMQGDIYQLPDVQKFIRSVDILSFENDYSYQPVLDKLAASQARHAHPPSQTSAPAATALQIHPSPHMMQTLTNRLLCKDILATYGFQSAPYAELPAPSSITTMTSLRKWLHTGGLASADKLILKTNTGGYDGRGTLTINPQSAEALEQISVFTKTHAPTTIVAEAFIPFTRELAITALRSTTAEISFFPLVETKQTHHQCDWVNGPIMAMRHLKHSTSTADTSDLRSYQLSWSDDGQHLRVAFIQLIEAITTMLNATSYVGAITFELFELDDKLMVNEVSPRVHNSCHYSMNATSSSQFDLHLKALLGWSLGQPKLLKPGFAMANLIGTACATINLHSPAHSFLHWYGKHPNQAGRKMGHLNTLAASKEQALNLALTARRQIRV